MPEVELDQASTADIVAKLQKYFEDELQQEIGAFDAEFLLGFFSEHVGNYYYNQGLADALAAFDKKVEDFNDSIYQLQKDTERFNS